MFHYKLQKIPLLVAAFSFLMTSCFKDVDFEQAQDIKLAPDLEADLLFYTINETDFEDSETNAFTPVIRDTVRLEFLDDDYTQDGLMHAEFRFRHENRFPYLIKSSIRFLSENDRTQFSVNYDIPPGSNDSPTIVDTIHVVSGNDIGKVRRSINMLVELEMIDGGKDIEGELDFSSKGLFKFEF
ncbi:hypothetical protein [Christiangramia forsetii]|uniref:Secreted protein n=2 Tax=Christiangramia forsetii TaxID=411153 RepID=A0M5B6_CHRFK|nr:hypothetical protein [Christiangramia forsetii]GGG21371.1 hypothetical protein GCM10011532_00470 [Christiangramia forsetii]CAL67811.1 secreted protein [Christiangramia forsetii KT0803]